MSLENKFKIVQGDLLSSGADIIVHQVNCCGVMGSGIAKQVKEQYPLLYERYRDICNDFARKKEEILGTVYYYQTAHGPIIANIFGQKDFGWGRRFTNYTALCQGLKYVQETAKLNNFTVAVPYNLGCGRGGGDWDTVYGMLCDIFDSDTLEIWKL